MEEKIKKWEEQFEKSTAEEVLDFFCKEFREHICFSSSMGAEDMVIIDMLMKINPKTRIFTLDTGRMFPETLNLIHTINEKYNIKIEVFFPDFKQVQQMVREKGINLFYESVENRKLCCNIRKMEPLKRALNGMKAWITGIRKDQTLNRFNTKIVEWDKSNLLVKINPLYRWSEKMVWQYIHSNQIPYNSLHDKGFPSIGCQPCTRAISPGEDSRAGRWWWEDQGHKECGLHIKDN